MITLQVPGDSPLAPLAGQRVKLIEALKTLPGTQLKSGKNHRWTKLEVPV